MCLQHRYLHFNKFLGLSQPERNRCLLDVIHPVLVQMSEISHVNPNVQQMALKCLILQQLHLKNQRALGYFQQTSVTGQNPSIIQQITIIPQSFSIKTVVGTKHTYSQLTYYICVINSMLQLCGDPMTSPTQSCWILQQLWLTFASESPFSINSVVSFGNS